MSSTSLERRRMTFEDYLALPDEVRAEYLDGEVVMTPPGSMPHNEIGARLLLLLRSSLRDVHVGYDMGLELAPRRRRIPDLAVVDELEDALFTRQVPHLVVEILSPSTRREDTMRKTGEYHQAGIGQYWIVDPESHELTVLRDNGAGWDMLLELNGESSRGSVPIGDYGVVDLDLDALLAP